MRADCVQLHSAAGKAMNPVPQPFLIPRGLQSTRAGAVEISKSRRDAQSVTRLCGLAAGPAAGGRLASFPPF